MNRLPAIDVVRGLAVVLMVMHHVVDAWTQPADRAGTFWIWLRHAGGIPAPGFMVLAGVSAALVLSRERDKGVPVGRRVDGALRRGLYVLGAAFAFRLFAFVMGRNPLEKWESLFRVDVLNCLGAGLAIVGVACAPFASRRGAVTMAAVLAAFFVGLAPLVWGEPVAWPNELLGRYVAGPGRFALFPLFPWVGFIAAGYVVGEHVAVLARRDASDAGLRRAFRPYLALGAALFVGGWALAQADFRVYPPHDWWKASPEFIAMRFGVQLALLWLAFEVVTRLPSAWRSTNALAVLGRHSLLAYVLHLEFAYGLVVSRLHRAVPVEGALAGTIALAALCWAAARADEAFDGWRARARRRLAEAPAAPVAADPAA